MPLHERTFITGIGLVTPLGVGVERNLNALRSADCGISFGNAKVTLAHYWTDYYGAVQGFRPEEHIDDRAVVRKHTRGIHLALTAARLALADAALTHEICGNDTAGVIFGMGPEAEGADFMPVLEASLDTDGAFSYALYGTKGALRCPPLYILPRLPNTAAGQIAIRNKIRGLNFSIVNNANAGAIAIGEAYRAVRSGRASMVVTGGGNSPIGVIPVSRSGMVESLFDLSERGSAAFSNDRKGYIPAEGAAVLILESEASARARGARLYAELIAYSNAFNPRAGCDLSTEAAAYARSIRKTLDMAGLEPTQVDAINGNGIGLPMQDAAESIAIKDVFGDRAHGIPVSGTKSQTGYMEAASSAFEACVAALSIKHRFIPPTIRRAGDDEHCNLDFVDSRSREAELGTVLSLSFDPGGSMCGLVFRGLN